jgi:hypothetical protein
MLPFNIAAVVLQRSARPVDAVAAHRLRRRTMWNAAFAVLAAVLSVLMTFVLRFGAVAGGSIDPSQKATILPVGPIPSLSGPLVVATAGLFLPLGIAIHQALGGRTRR